MYNNEDIRKSIIPYDPKIDISLDSLQTLVACFEALKDEYRDKHNEKHNNNSSNDEEEDATKAETKNDPILEMFIRIFDKLLSCKLLVVVETQAAVNTAMLDLIESILAPAYPRAKHY